MSDQHPRSETVINNLFADQLNGILLEIIYDEKCLLITYSSKNHVAILILKKKTTTMNHTFFRERSHYSDRKWWFERNTYIRAVFYTKTCLFLIRYLIF